MVLVGSCHVPTTLEERANVILKQFGSAPLPRKQNTEKNEIQGKPTLGILDGKKEKNRKKRRFHFVPFLRFMCHHAVEDWKQNKREEGEEGELE